MDLNKKHLWKPIVAFVILLLANLLMFLTIWMSKKYDQVSLDQFIYQIKTSAAGANRSLMNSAYVRVGVYGAVLTLIELLAYLIVSGTLFYWISKAFHIEKLREFLVNCKALRYVANAMPFLAVGMLVFSIGFFTVKMNFVEYATGFLTKSTFIEDNYADPEEVTLTFPEKKRNLIYIFLESLEVTFAEPEAGGYIVDNFMPELTALAENHVNFSHDDNLGGALSYWGTNWTAAAMVTQTAGVPVQVPVLATNFGGDDPYMPGVVSIGELLDDAGYHNTLLVGSNADFGDRDDYFKDHGDFEIIDTESLKAEGRLDPDYRVWWGFEDAKLFQYAKEELTRLSQEEEPFNFTMLTCDTHFPNGYRCNLCQTEYKKKYPNVVACASRQLDEFIKWIQEQPFYENTTIVLCGDHLTMDPNFMQPVDPQYQRSIYNCIINPATEPVNEKNRQFGTFDMMPTTLAAMGVTIEGDRLGLGTNLFSDKKTLTEEYGHAYVNREFQKYSRFYNKVLLGM